MSCPYGVRYLNETERVVEKCTLCEQKIAQDELPQCVAQCGGRARFFGDLEQGLESFVAPGAPVKSGDKSYDGCAAARVTWATSPASCTSCAARPGRAASSIASAGRLASQGALLFCRFSGGT